MRDSDSRDWPKRRQAAALQRGFRTHPLPRGGTDLIGPTNQTELPAFKLQKLNHPDVLLVNYSTCQSVVVGPGQI
jgi:hypothetical protein